MLVSEDNARIEAVLEWWFGEPPLQPQAKWFRRSKATDAEIAERFGAEHARAASGELDHWTATARGTLALVILLDQFSRNLYRDSEQAFACDGRARQLCLEALQRQLDAALHCLERAFLYMPLMHSEDRELHQTSVSLYEALHQSAPAELAAACKSFCEFAHRHKVVIDRFGRYPHRNSVLGRHTTAQEQAFLAEHPTGF